MSLITTLVAKTRRATRQFEAELRYYSRLMKPKTVYASLCLVGTILPLYQFVPFLREHGLDIRLFVDQLFATPVSGFFGMDVVVSSIVLWVLVFVEGRRAGVKHLWAPVVANLAVGVSMGLPLFLYMRETRIIAANTKERTWPPSSQAG